MEIKHVDKDNAFEAFDENNVRMGTIVYSFADDGSLRATSTVVLPEFQGKGVAGKLLDALADYAREQGKKIVPVCSYVVSAFKRYSDKYADVAASSK